MDATRRGYEDAIKDPESAAEVLLKAAPELDRELVVESQKYLADQYQADAKAWGDIDAKRWNRFFSWVSKNKLASDIPAGAGMTTQFLK